MAKQTFKSAARVAAIQRIRLSRFNYERTLRALVNNASNFEINKTSLVKASRVVSGPNSFYCVTSRLF